MFPVDMVGKYYPFHDNALHRVIDIVNTYDLDDNNTIRNNVFIESHIEPKKEY